MPQPNCAKRLESARSLLPLSDHPTPYDSASKLDAKRFAQIVASLQLCGFALIHLPFHYFWASGWASDEPGPEQP